MGSARTEHFDVVIVGARCAGAPLAALLAGHGVRVAVVERSTFPKDTLSSHTFQSDALRFLDRLGLTDRLRATGAPVIRAGDARFEDVRFVADYPDRPGDVGGAACIRRHVLDPILADAAIAAGADVRMGTRAVEVLEDGGRVCGVVVEHGSTRSVLCAPLVVGADGRNSTVAQQRGARPYNVTEGRRLYYWTYFENADLSGTPTFVFHRWGDRFVLGAPADNGLYMVGVSPERAERETFRHDLDRSLMDHAMSCEPIAATLSHARRATRVFGVGRFSGYFREPAGPGWVLVGDAGHFKDPAAGRGIGDAFCQVDELAPAIVVGLGASPQVLDRELRRWGAWRDRTFADHYWFGVDLGQAGPVPRVLPELVRRLHADGRSDLVFDLLSHRVRPSQVLTVPRLAGALGVRLRQRGDRWGLLRETGGLLAANVRRQWSNRYPSYAAADEGNRSGGRTPPADLVRS